MAQSTRGNLLNISKNSRPLCAVMTLNLPLSSTNLRAESACSGSGSTTSKVGRTMLFDIPDVEELGVAGGGDGTPILARGAVQRRTDLGLPFRQFAQGHFESGAVGEPV